MENSFNNKFVATMLFTDRVNIFRIPHPNRCIQYALTRLHRDIATGTKNNENHIRLEQNYSNNNIFRRNGAPANYNI